MDHLARAKTLRRKHRTHLCDLGLGNGFLDVTSQAQGTKGKIGKLVFIKIENFSASKVTVKKVKIQSIVWKKILLNHASDEGLLSRIYKELLQLNNKKTA